MSDFVGIGFNKKYWALVAFFIHDENTNIQPPQINIIQENTFEEFQETMAYIEKNFKCEDYKTEIKVLFSYANTDYNSFDLNFTPYEKEDNE